MPDGVRLCGNGMSLGVKLEYKTLILHALAAFSSVAMNILSHISIADLLFSSLPVIYA